MAANREGRDTPIAQFTPPVKGVWRTVAAHQLPQDALYDASNVCIRSGACVSRPGYDNYVSGGALTGTPTGLIDYISAAAVRTPIAGTTSRLYQLTGGLWVNRTGAITWAGSLDTPVRMTLLEFGTPAVVYAIACNGTNTPAQFDSTSGVFSAIAGTPPVFSDVTTAFDRIVGVVPPYSIRWGEALSLSTWAATNIRNLADTPDPIVTIRNIGTSGVVVYKDKSIWLGQSQGGPSSSAFAFALAPGTLGVDGPAGKQAVVDVNGIQYYISLTGRIGAFDGSRHRWVADGFWPYARAAIDTTYMSRAVAVFNPVYNEVYFYCPTTSSSGVNAGIYTLSLPYPEAGITDYAAFPGGITAFDVSTGGTIRNSSNLDVAVVLASDTSEAYYAKEGHQTDDGTAFSGYIQTGLVPTPEIEDSAANVEPFLARGYAYGTATYSLMYSDVLDTAGGSLGDSFTVDLTTVPNKDLQGFTTRGRFFGLKAAFSHPVTFTYYGAHMYARSLGRGSATNPNR